MQVQGVNITADSSLTAQEIESIALQEINEWELQGKEIASLNLAVEGNEIVLQAIEKSPISRVRRITGYLSNIENFNDAKRSECRDRYVHVK